MNKHMKLTEKLPIEVRLDIYKKAIPLYERAVNDSNNNFVGYDYLFGCSGGLCLVLPCILWGLSHFSNDDPYYMSWSWHDTPTAFPEIRSFIESLDYGHYNFTREKNQRRLEILQEIVKTLENHVEKM